LFIRRSNLIGKIINMGDCHQDSDIQKKFEWAYSNITEYYCPFGYIPTQYIDKLLSELLLLLDNEDIKGSKDKYTFFYIQRALSSGSLRAAAILSYDGDLVDIEPSNWRHGEFQDGTFISSFNQSIFGREIPIKMKVGYQRGYAVISISDLAKFVGVADAFPEPKVKPHKIGHSIPTEKDSTDTASPKEWFAGSVGGRPPHKLFDDFIRELIKIANGPDGLPEPKALTAQMKDWAAQYDENPPSDTTIRDWINRFDYRQPRRPKKIAKT
jgi:hypothetical protein